MLTQYSLQLLDSDSIHDAVMQDLMERKAVGLKTYGRALTADSPEDMLQMAYEEALDMACYLKTEIEKQKRLVQGQSVSKPSLLTAQEIPARGDFNDTYISIATWVELLTKELLPRYLKEVGHHTIPFSLDGLREWIEKHYPYRDCHKRLSSAFKRLKEHQLVYSPSRYSLAITGKFYAEYQLLYNEQTEDNPSG